MATQTAAVPAAVQTAIDAEIALVGANVRNAITKRRGLGLPCSADDLPTARKLSALLEEVGEVGQAIQNCEGRERLRSELRDVAVIAVMWAATVTNDDAGAW